VGLLALHHRFQPEWEAPGVDCAVAVDERRSKERRRPASPILRASREPVATSSATKRHCRTVERKLVFRRATPHHFLLVDFLYESKYHELEERQWWFRSRRDFVSDLVRQIALPREARILEIGCSGGPLIIALQRAGYTEVDGIDVSETGIELARRRGLSRVSVMGGAKLLFDNATFDLVIASDVLEHIADDHGALVEWKRVMRPAGRLIVFVPAFQALWGRHDEVNQHFRRYSRGQLRAAIEHAGLHVERASYWNATLGLPGAAVRLARRLLPPSRDGNGSGDLLAPPRALDEVLFRLVQAENRAMRFIDLPFGMSVFAIARRD
jgi:SAM-dependent methyltransferase